MNKFKNKVPSFHKRFGLIIKADEPKAFDYYAENEGNRKWKANKRLPSAWLLLLISIGVLAVSYLADKSALSNEIKIKNWFGRSGAILVAVLIWVEADTRVANINSLPMHLNLLATMRYHKLVVAFEKLAFTTGLFGTLVWAYGDVWFK
jgi:hypothetical protein